MGFKADSKAPQNQEERLLRGSAEIRTLQGDPWILGAE